MSKANKRTEKQTERMKAFTDWLKSMIFPVILLLIILGGVFTIINYQNIEAPEEIIEVRAYAGDDKPLTLKNDELELTMDPLTTQFELKVKDSGKVWYSNPNGGAEDALALADEKAKLQSTLLMSYSVTAGLETTFNTYGYSIQNGIYEIEQGDDFIKVNYSLGNVEKEYVIPPVTTEEAFDKWCDNMSLKDKNLVQQYYKKYSLSKLGKKDNKEELLANYPILEDGTIYVLRDSTKENVRKQMQGIFEAAGYTYEDYVYDKENDNSTKSSDKPIFNVDVIYRLDGKDLLVEIPLSELEFKTEYPMYTITPLPYFGAGGTKDKGYMLVPEGGGSIINFNNGKTSQSSYYANVYGWDMCLSRKAVVHNTRAYYGVFGVSDNENSFICILEDGGSYASVQADVSGKNNSYNFVNSIYSICSREQYDVGDIANSDIYQYNKDLPDESLIQRYRFIDSGSYVDMSKEYGNYLQNKYGDYMAMNDDTSVPVAIEVVGAVDKVKQICGIPVSRPLELTTYKEASELITDLKNEGMDNMSVKLTGWCNEGVKQNILTKVKPVACLGSKKDLKNLIKTANDQGVDLYLNGATQYEYGSNIFDGFFSYRDAAKFISKERAEQFIFSAVTYQAREYADSYYLLHTELANKIQNKLVSTANDYNAGAAFQDVGMDLSSDFYKKNKYSREAVKNLESETIKSANELGTKLMVNMGNDYVAMYSDMVTRMDLPGSEYTILDARVPFYQMAIHGYVNYTGNPLNICGNTEDEILYSAEYGAGLCFNLMKESSFTLQKTLYTEYYGSDYSAWHDRMMNIYNRYNSELGHVFNQEMVGHEKLTADVSCTEYADGTKVYVNYGYTQANVDGVTVPARDYLVKK